MDLKKKLVILTGKHGNGTALIEHNGMGAFVTLNTFSLPDLSLGEYALGVKTEMSVFKREVGSLGRIKSRFALPDGDYSAVHLVLFRTVDEEVVLYGASETRKLWEGNIMDGLRRERVEKKAFDIQKASAPQAEEFTYSERKIEDYFLDIKPAEYADDKLADVNYFEYSGIAAQSDNDYYEKPAMPSEMQRRYLNGRFGSVSRLTRVAGGTAGSGTAAKESVYTSATVTPERESGVKESAQSENNEVRKSVNDAAPAQSADAVAATAESGISVSALKTESVPRIKNASMYTAEEAVAAVKTDADFFNSVKPKLDLLFERGEPFMPLGKALPSTRWVKVDYDGGGRYYVVGLIGNAPDFIAYGVPGKYGNPPEAFENADFIPLNAATPDGNGFWVLFQSATTGEEVKRRF